MKWGGVGNADVQVPRLPGVPQMPRGLRAPEYPNTVALRMNTSGNETIFAVHRQQEIEENED